MPLSQVLAELSRQTGNQVVDRRPTRTDPKLDLALQNNTFWSALEAIAKAAGCGISTYQPDGQVALVDAPWRSLPTVHQGIFRITAKRFSVTRDDDAGTHVCTITLDLPWEPRFEPLYLEVGPMQAVFAADGQGAERQVKVPGQGKVSVAGRSALEVDIRLPAPMRSCAKIKSLEGQFHLTGPGKTLTFAFSPLKAFKKGAATVRQAQEGVEVSLVEIKTASNRWSVRVHIANPPGNPKFESYQSWLGNNRITLEKGQGPDRKIWTPRIGDEEVIKETAAGAEILYSFHISPKENKGVPAEWTLVYRTPGRIVETLVPFTFNDLLLP